MTGRTQQIDISSDVCPMTFVRTRLALDRLDPGDLLVVRLRGAEVLRNVTASATGLGHTVLDLRAAENGLSELTLRRA